MGLFNGFPWYEHNFQYLADASDLGIPPGKTPSDCQEPLPKGGNGTVSKVCDLRWSRGSDGSWMAKEPLGIRSFIIFND